MAKIMCYAPAGGTANLRAIDQSITGGANSLNGLEFEQYKRAKLMAAPANGGDLAAAKTFLEEAGWTCYWDGEPVAGNNDKWDMRLPADLKAWALENGGAALVRQLLQAARERQEAGPTDEASRYQAYHDSGQAEIDEAASDAEEMTEFYRQVEDLQKDAPGQDP